VVLEPEEDAILWSRAFKAMALRMNPRQTLSHDGMNANDKTGLGSYLLLSASALAPPGTPDVEL
jgi:hypothetical protein